MDLVGSPRTYYASPQLRSSRSHPQSTSKSALSNVGQNILSTTQNFNGPFAHASAQLPSGEKNHRERGVPSDQQHRQLHCQHHDCNNRNPCHRRRLNNKGNNQNDSAFDGARSWVKSDTLQTAGTGTTTRPGRNQSGNHNDMNRNRIQNGSSLIKSSHHRSAMGGLGEDAVDTIIRQTSTEGDTVKLRPDSPPPPPPPASTDSIGSSSSFCSHRIAKDLRILKRKLSRKRQSKGAGHNNNNNNNHDDDDYDRNNNNNNNNSNSQKNNYNINHNKISDDTTTTNNNNNNYNSNNNNNNNDNNNNNIDDNNKSNNASDGGRGDQNRIQIDYMAKGRTMMAPCHPGLPPCVGVSQHATSNSSGFMMGGRMPYAYTNQNAFLSSQGAVSKNFSRAPTNYQNRSATTGIAPVYSTHCNDKDKNNNEKGRRRRRLLSVNQDNAVYNTTSTTSIATQQPRGRGTNENTTKLTNDVSSSSSSFSSSDTLSSQSRQGPVAQEEKPQQLALRTPVTRSSAAAASSSSSSSSSFSKTEINTPTPKNVKHPNFGETPSPARRPANAPPRGLVGLGNIGNTCFLNSILQCLSNLPDLRSYFVAERHLTELNTKNKGSRGALARAFGTLMTEMWAEPDSQSDTTSYGANALSRRRYGSNTSQGPPVSGTTSSFSLGGGRRGEGGRRNTFRTSVLRPTELKHVVGKYASRFIGYMQQDAHEFLRYLVDGLHEDLNRVLEEEKPKYEEIKDIPHEEEQDRSQRWWQHFCDRNNSRIKDIFGGQLRSEVCCQQCGNVSVAYDPMYDVSIPVPKKRTRGGGGGGGRGGRGGTRNQYGPCSSSSSSSSYGRGMMDREDTQFSVTDCLKEFTKDEVIHNQYVCPKCKEVRAVRKVLSFVRCPAVLVLHINRFSDSVHRRRKLTNSITIQHEINLAEFCHWGSPTQTKPIYELRGVCNHMGGMGGGHYTADCVNADTDRWFNFNDSGVTLTEKARLSGSGAYVLFYTRKKTDETVFQTNTRPSENNTNTNHINNNNNNNNNNESTNYNVAVANNNQRENEGGPAQFPFSPINPLDGSIIEEQCV